MNPMRNIRIEKITLNVGAGKEQNRLDKGVRLLKTITGIEPVKTVATKRIPGWGLRPGLPIGCKITIRGGHARKLLAKLLEAVDNRLLPKQFDEGGNVSFGISEYINIPDVKYDPDIGMAGLEVCVTLERPGYRIKRRKISKKKIPKSHRISPEESMKFMEKELNIKVGEEEE